MDYNTEVVNITKIKDGFFLGDEATASNLDVIIQFKITHMINAAGSQIINAWESIGIKYLTLNWSENQNQNLFDQKDEIANRIVNFIDDSFKSGEGLLVHSLRGQNRACVVVILYLIKKFRWTLAKSLEFLTNKKFDVEIPKFFLNQLSFFESRLSKSGQGPRTSSWTENGNDSDPDELLIRNTYLNGLAQKNEKNMDNLTKPYNYIPNKKIVWADANNSNNRNPLCSTNLGRELMFQKDIKPVLNHKKLKPAKSSLKTRSSSADIKKPSNLYTSKLIENVNMSLNKEVNTSSNNLNSSNLMNTKLLSSVNYPDNNTMKGNPNSSSELHKNYANLGVYSSNTSNVPNMNFENSMKNKENHNSGNMSSITGMNHINNSLSHLNITGNANNQTAKPTISNIPNNQSGGNSRQNNFNLNQNNPQVRSYSVGNDPAKNNNTNNSTNNNNPSSALNNQGETKIIIASKFKNVIHNSYNNIYIQSAEDLEKIYNNNNREIPSTNNTGNNYENNLLRNEKVNPNVQTKKENLNPIPQSYILNRSGVGNLNNNLSSNNNFVNPTNPNKNNTVNLNNYNNFNKESSENNSNPMLNSNKLTKSGENQRMLQNNFFMNNTTNMTSNAASNNVLEYNKLKVIDYTTPPSQVSQLSQINNKPGMNSNIGQMYLNKTPVISTSTNNVNNVNNSSMKVQGLSINNYQPELNKKNNFNIGSSNSNTGLLSRPSSQMNKQGPIKIQSEFDKKPSTPDNIYQSNNLSTVKLNSTVKNTPLQQYGTIKRSSSKNRNESNDRPSTAPQKEYEKTQMTGNSSLKRLPSPNLKSGATGMSSSGKNMPMGSNIGQINLTKYRSPSPTTLNKSSTIMIGSLKTNGVGKQPKWK